MIEIRHQTVLGEGTVQSAYDAFYRRRKLLMRDSFYLWLLQLAQPQAGELLVDVACGNGRLVELAAKRGIAAVGFDLSLEGIQAAASATNQAGWVVGNGQTIPFPDGCADIVLSIGSLEHYDQPAQGARELARILKPYGRALILLPNAFGLLGNMRHVYRHGEVFDDEQPLQRYATRRTWEVMLHRGGLVVEQLTPFGEFNAPRTFGDALWTLLRPQKLVKAAITHATPVNWANHFVFICRRAAQQETARLEAAHYPMLAYP